MRYAAIDIGSNAVRLLIADITEKDRTMVFKKNTLIRVPLRLGDDAFLEKEISDKKAEDLVRTMIAFHHLMDVYKVSDYMACATSAMREARNGNKIVNRIKKEALIQIEIIDGQREADIIYASHIELSLEKKKNYLYIDVGGGSTELSVFSNGELISSRSFNLGGIRILDNQDKEETWVEMKTWIKEKTRKFGNLSAIGTGGNINKLFRIADGKDGEPISLSSLRTVYTMLNSYSLKDRIRVLGLNSDRADVIIPAAEIYLAVMKWGGVRQIYVPRVGLVDGIIQLLIDRNLES